MNNIFLYLLKLVLVVWVYDEEEEKNLYHVKKKKNDGRRSRRIRAFDFCSFLIVILICF